MEETRGVIERGNDELFVTAQTMGGGRNWGNIREILSKMERLISKYEIQEAMSIYELALWKAYLDEAGNSVTDWNMYCAQVPGPAKDTIIQFLW